MKLTKTEEAIMRTFKKHGDEGYTVTLPNHRKASRDAMAKLRTRGLAVQESRGMWYGNWLTAAGLEVAGIEK